MGNLGAKFSTGQPPHRERVPAGAEICKIVRNLWLAGARGEKYRKADLWLFQDPLRGDF
jgi:hypothetical protein